MKIKKRGELSLSFSFIFSIILIVAIIGIAIYTINYFLDLGRCTDISLFYNDFQREIDSAWSSEITRDTFTGKLPGNIESFCVGNLNNALDEPEYNELKRYSSIDANAFIYPPKNACEQPFKKIQHIDTGEIGFECFQVNNGRVEIGLEKGSFDSLVKVKKKE